MAAVSRRRGMEELAGILRVTVRVAVTHPAEVIEITFEQQMQKSQVGGAGRWRPGTGSAV